MNLDMMNGCFEFIGAYFTWMNAYALYKAKSFRGVYWQSTAFFMSWGIWNLVYYRGLQQYFSWIGGMFLVSGNLVWVMLAIKYRNKNDKYFKNTTY